MKKSNPLVEISNPIEVNHLDLLIDMDLPFEIFYEINSSDVTATSVDCILNFKEMIISPKYDLREENLDQVIKISPENDESNNFDIFSPGHTKCALSSNSPLQNQKLTNLKEKKKQISNLKIEFMRQTMYQNLSFVKDKRRIDVMIKTFL